MLPVSDTFLSFILFFCTAHCVTIIQNKQKNVKFSKLIINFCFLLHVSNLVGSSSGIYLYMQYGFFGASMLPVWWVGKGVRDSTPTEWIFVKIDIRISLENLSRKFNFH